MKTTKIISIYISLIISALHYSSVCAAEEKALETVATSTQTILGKTVEGLAAAGPYVNVTIQAYNIGQEIRKHNFPTIKEKAHAEDVAEKYALITAENEFQKCLITNRNNKTINHFGRPVECENIAQMYSMLGGENEVNRLTAIYNQYKM
jgi:hypothetical protein